MANKYDIGDILRYDVDHSYSIHLLIQQVRRGESIYSMLVLGENRTIRSFSSVVDENVNIYKVA